MTPRRLVRPLLCSTLLSLGLCGCVTVQGGDKPVQFEGTLNVNFKTQQAVDQSLIAMEIPPGQAPTPATMAAVAQTKDQILARLRQRIPALKQAKAAGLIGETPAGYLEAVNPAQLNDLTIVDLITAQNADRWRLYTTVAKENGTPFDAVAQQFAKGFAERAAKGDHLKAPDGTWHPKP
jgi:uncharacterized protein YdbL (DUF1318 family)